MAARPVLDVGDLTEEELRDIVGRIQDALWPRGRERDQWTPDTVQGVAQVLCDYNLDPAEAR